MQKIAILSDIHGNLLALEKVMDDIKTRGVDYIANLGDHVSGPLWPKETIEYLMKQDWIHIKGNHERQLTDQDPRNHGPSDGYAFQRLTNAELNWLRSLPARMEMENFLLIHGTPVSDSTYLLETVERGRARLATQEEITERLGGTKSPIILCGHTHIPRVVEAAGFLIVNPGSVGLPAYDDNVPEYHVMESGSPHARYAIMEYKNGHWQAKLMTITYDHQQAAKQARRNGRPDWEVGLQTGFMQPIKAGQQNTHMTTN
jgi:putative phosphoesterase